MFNEITVYIIIALCVGFLAASLLCNAIINSSELAKKVNLIEADTSYIKEQLSRIELELSYIRSEVYANNNHPMGTLLTTSSITANINESTLSMEPQD
jgi:hypothetical protein